MRLKLIFPKGQQDNFWDLKTFSIFTGKKGSGIPLSLPTLAAHTPSDVNIDIVDENVEEINFNDKPDLVGISFFTSFAPRAYQIAKAYRSQGVKVVLGGIHASMLKEEAILHADSVVVGEAERIWKEVIKDFRETKLKRFYQGRPYLFDKQVIPRWDLVSLDDYNFFSIQATRGCPYDCEFCSVTAFLGRRCRFKPIEHVVEEIQYLKSLDKKKAIVFVDDNIAASHQYAKELFRALIPLKISWWGQAAFTIANDDELLDLMHESGCSQIFIGFESLSQKSLDSMKKGKINKSVNYPAAVEKIHSRKTSVFASFILGSDFDDQEVFRETERFVNINNIAFALIGLQIPFPGTQLHKRLKFEGRLLHEDWAKYTGHVPCFKPLNMSPETLQEEHRAIMRNIYSFDALYSRLSALWDRGVLVRGGSSGKNFSKKKLYVGLKSLFLKDLEKISFVNKSLWHKNNPRFSSILSAIDFHDLVYSFPLKEGIPKIEVKLKEIIVK